MKKPKLFQADASWRFSFPSMLVGSCHHFSILHFDNHPFPFDCVHLLTLTKRHRCRCRRQQLAGRACAVNPLERRCLFLFFYFLFFYKINMRGEYCGERLQRQVILSDTLLYVPSVHTLWDSIFHKWDAGSPLWAAVPTVGRPVPVRSAGGRFVVVCGHLT